MPITVGHDTAKTRKTLKVGDQSLAYYSIPAATAAGLGDFSNLPAALKVVLENMLRFEDGKTVSVDDIKAFAEWGAKGGKNPREIAYRPARVLMQDFTGVPAVVDLAAMRDGIVALGGDAQQINPLNPVDLVIDHSVMIDEFGNPRAFQMNVDREYERNLERYTFLKWGQSAFSNFRVVPPGTGICHQVNLEYLSQTVWTDVDQNGEEVAYPDTLVGTDSHTTMVNGAAVLGWGVGGIEAEASMLGQPISMLIPEVVGFKLTGAMMEGTTGTDLVLKVVEMLRAHGVVGKFVEFYGEGLDSLPLADRATIANMAPEYGATCGFFPIDDETLRYLRNTGRDEDRVQLVEAYAKENGSLAIASDAPPQVLAMKQVAKKGETEFQFLSTKSSAEILKLLLGGQAMAGFATGTHLDYLESGELKMIASANRDRHPYAPETQTLVEQGFDVYVDPWFYFAMSADTPDEASSAIASALAAALDTDKVKTAVFNALSTEVVNLGTDGTKQMLVEGVENTKILFGK